MKKPLFLILSIAVLTSCGATFSQKDCVNADWREIGYNDATSGKPIADFDNYAPICKEVSVTPNGRQYQEGYLDGIDDYCTEENGLARGSDGRAYDKSCPSSTPYYEAYREGIEKFKEEQERYAIERLTRPQSDRTDSTAVAGGRPDD